MAMNVLWREYLLLPVPVLGVEWVPIPGQAQSKPDTEAITSSPSSPNAFHLGLIVYGWQPTGKSGLMGLGNGTTSTNTSNSSSDRNGTNTDVRLEGRNVVLLVDLDTGYSHSIRGSSPSGLAEVPMRSGGLGSGTPSHRSHMSSSSQSELEGPVELARVSHNGREAEKQHFVHQQITIPFDKPVD
ncbi:unnamed protein product [Echinostoma caproni]|uniref:Secreted protein n=1 Tax=Echinostoma caproni TaxID=27848 RepID=A0A183BFE6_9TREM|nr:unnamed protein product [Echinostoma caproni]